MKDNTPSQNDQQQQSIVDKELIKQRMMEEAQKIKIRQSQGPYHYDNPHLEHKTKRQKKLEELEEKYKGVPKIAFHKLTDEGNLKFMQVQRDMVWTTIGWSFIGNIFGIAVVQYIERSSNRWKNLRQFKRREFMKVLGFIGTVGMFTYYGYARARQEFVRQKLQIVKDYSIEVSEK